MYSALCGQKHVDAHALLSTWAFICGKNSLHSSGFSCRDSLPFRAVRFNHEAGWSGLARSWQGSAQAGQALPIKLGESFLYGSGFVCGDTVMLKEDRDTAGFIFHCLRSITGLLLWLLDGGHHKQTRQLDQTWLCTVTLSGGAHCSHVTHMLQMPQWGQQGGNRHHDENRH